MKIIQGILLIPLLLFAALMIFSGKSDAQYPEDPAFTPPEGFYLEYIVLFSETEGKNRLRLFTSIIYDDLTFLKTDGEFKAEYRATFSILDKNGKYIDSQRLNRLITTGDFFDTNSRAKFDRLMVDFDLPPGEYKVILEFKDRESRKSLQQEKTVQVQSLTESKLLISGPILLDSVKIAEDETIDLRTGVSGDIFDGGKNIWVYFEVYSQKFPADLNILYRLLDDKGQERITGSYSRTTENPILRDKFLLETKEFNYGNYTLSLIVTCGEASAQKSRRFRIHWPGLPPIITNLDAAIEQLNYIASEREIARMKENYQVRRLEMFVKFWSKWSKGDEVEGYKLMEEYYRRIHEANQLFPEGGWKSDRGHVYVVHGPPSEIDRHPYDLYSKAYEIWYYLEDNKRFIFVDEGGFGDFRLQSPFWGGN